VSTNIIWFKKPFRRIYDMTLVLLAVKHYICFILNIFNWRILY
jgi:hypothetical protein